jgi:hypothetical protein
MPRTQEVPLDFTNLAHLDEGRINKVLLLHLQRTAGDCIARPGDKTKRKVSLEFTIEPIIDETGDCAEARIEVECKSKVPVHRSKPYSMRVSNRGFAFNADFPDSIDQQALFNGDEK